MQAQPKPTLQPLVEWRAGRIHDPVLKLKYLRAAAPRLQKSDRKMHVGLRLLPLVLVFVTISACLVAAMVRVEPLPHHIRHVRVPVLGAEGLPDVWQVEATRDWEVYSNGLRIDNRFALGNHPRSYRVYRLEKPDEVVEEQGTRPAGIVFHTTESQQAPFEAGKNRLLRQASESLVDYVRRHHAYNFLIDRFGRVYRIVNESDVAEHAGHSIWADRDSLFVGLNESFLGVSFEAKTEPGQEVPAVSPGQLRAASMLIEMLRARYNIRASNCVTHAQVSVNPANMRVGWHTDWASSFPFEQLGLPNNYDLPIAALSAFGFEADSTYLSTGGSRLAGGVDLAEEHLRQRAISLGIDLDVYRKSLQRSYRERFHRANPPVAEGAE